MTCWATLAANGVLNAFVLNVPPPTAAGAGGLYERQSVIDAVSDIAGAWEPDFAVATSDRLRASREWAPSQPVVGWVTYLRADRRVAAEIGGADVSHTASGTLIAISSDWLDVAAGDIERTAAALERTGALSPMVPRV